MLQEENQCLFQTALTKENDSSSDLSSRVLADILDVLTMSYSPSNRLQCQIQDVSDEVDHGSLSGL